MLNQSASPTSTRSSLPDALTVITQSPLLTHTLVPPARARFGRTHEPPPINRIASALAKAAKPLPGTQLFDGCVLDRSPALLEESYRLRYQVYCVERGFLSPDDYPQATERDQYDQSSVHIGAIDRAGNLAGTGRLIFPYDGSLPTLERCVAAPVAGSLWGPTTRWVEVSRLSMSRSYAHTAVGSDMVDRAIPDHRSVVLLTLLKGLYQGARRAGATHLLVSIERSLHRMLWRQGFPFRQMGPQFEYLGPVAPYAMDVREFEDRILAGQFPAISDFVESRKPFASPRHGAVTPMAREFSSTLPAPASLAG
jgi:N-acyl amino acid synthase of PEP-CTERM/exosortase system